VLLLALGAYAFLGEPDKATVLLEQPLEKLGNNFGLLTEITDPATGAGLGNMPQGISHLALLHAIFSLQEIDRIRGTDL